tara:strand:- start:751 stop:909 length:159 start_codon:yes stop_codon:yes gene_type:complete
VGLSKEEIMIREFLSYIALTVFAFGWMDTLWIFGVENSQWYTWWGLIYMLGN